MRRTPQSEETPFNSFQRGRIVLMSFGLGGNSYHYENPNVTGSWYARADEVTKLIEQGHYTAQEMEGAVLLDKVPALEADGGYSHAFNSPMVKSDLDPGARDEFAERLAHSAPFAAMLVQEVPQFRLFLAGHLAHDGKDGPGPLDYVSVPEYVAWWHARGARVGCVKDGRAVWDTRA